MHLRIQYIITAYSQAFNSHAIFLIQNTRIWHLDDTSILSIKIPSLHSTIIVYLSNGSVSTHACTDKKVPGHHVTKQYEINIQTLRKIIGKLSVRTPKNTKFFLGHRGVLPGHIRRITKCHSILQLENIHQVQQLHKCAQAFPIISVCKIYPHHKHCFEALHSTTCRKLPTSQYMCIIL